MSVQYAKSQPAGFSNQIQNVAIVGASGNIGGALAKALVSTGKHTVTGLTRASSDSQLPDGVKKVPVDFDSDDSLVAALKGHDFLIITLAVSAPPDLHGKIVKAATKAGIPWIMPNTFGTDSMDEDFFKNNPIGPAYAAVMKDLEAAEVSWVSLACGFWYEFSIAMGEVADAWFGIEPSKHKAVLIDDGRTAIPVSTWAQCGRAVAALLSLKVLPDDENDAAPTLSQWRNKSLYVSSFVASQGDMLASVQRAQGTTDKDWQVTLEPSDERYARGLRELQQGQRLGFVTAMYTHAFMPKEKSGDVAKYTATDEVLGLPKEDFDAATAEGLELAKKMKLIG